METESIDDLLRRGLRGSMRRAAMTYADVAETAGINIRSVKHLGDQSTARTLYKVSLALGCNPGDLFAESDR